jgi:uncharacterized protein (TIGR00297 family)
MPSLETLAVVLALCAALTLISYRLRLLTRSGSVASFLMGAIIGLFGSVNWLLLLIAFALIGFLVTRFKLELKIKKGVQEGRQGERTYKNVLANGLVPAIVVVVSFASGNENSILAGIVYIASLSEAASDTIASELGVLSSKVRLITNFSKVEVGTDGGVSLYGTFWALMAAIFASIIGWLVVLPNVPLDVRVLVPIAFGFMGCFLDSLIGATLERGGKISKLGNNILSMAFAAIGSYALLLAI